ncbi:3-dehydroquinate synthase II [Kineosporia sp. NBRC 101731]|uniref:3-dehydroquinate synthase II n=1 Tax=Kineosporia sp. NBRC 101731 TaxID=3032199 RepID=UPI0024A47238|nr:3-dehydroquinate synthase II [Kineosporia sp. NBRC 101731]GLY28168.1 3-dehydroquinate synthase II [Kineosporia sp. NBRC 101731]
MKLCWLDVTTSNGSRAAIVEEALHHGIDGILTDDLSTLESVPPSVTRVLFLREGSELPDELPGVDVMIADPARHGDPAVLALKYPDVEVGPFVEIVDAPSLEKACRAAATQKWSLLRFRDPTKIPLEIVLAAADRAQGSIITEVADVEEAGIVFGVLERGSDGVLLTPQVVGDAARLAEAAQTVTPELELVELVVTEVAHVGMGERACVDTCTHFRQDEGILVGSHSTGMILCVSETHPLPYMPTRPFRVNAGAIHSYTLSVNERTNYLSELRSGSQVLAVDTKGQTRAVTVGRVKIETRPLLSVTAQAHDGTRVNLILQDDWHVRVLGPGDAVLNSTELTPGDRVWGYLPTASRHVGYPIDEFCLEQ